MNENKDDNKVVYTIPGVIIPQQQTENGQIIQSDLTSIKKEENVVSTDTSVSLASNNVSGIGNNSSFETNTNENINNNIESNITLDANTKTELVNENIVTAQPLSVPDLNNVPKFNDLENKNIKPKKEKKVKIKKTGGGSSKYILIIIILLALLGYFIYKDYIKPKETIDPVKEMQMKKTINNNSLIVQELYNYVNLDGCEDQINFFYNGIEINKLADLTNENKNYMAYRVLKHSDVQIKNCNNYSSALNKNDPVKLWHCGDYLNNGNELTTEVISSEVLKRQVEKMFGEGSYKEVTFTTASSGRFLYDNRSNSYIYQTFDGRNNTCNKWNNTLDKVYRQNNDIVLAVKTQNSKSKRIYMFYYTFQESDDGNYYFSSMQKKAVQ